MRYQMKKRIMVMAGLVLSLLALAPACDLLEECGTCELVTIDADGNTSYGTPMLYCGDDLKDKQNSSPITVGGVTTYWDCY
jgi:hypothetical protein